MNPNYVYILVAAVAVIVGFKILKWTMKLAWIVLLLAVGACALMYFRNGTLPW